LIANIAIKYPELNRDKTRQFDLDQAMTGDAYQMLAARLKKSSNPDPLRFIKQQAQLVLWREV